MFLVNKEKENINICYKANIFLVNYNLIILKKENKQTEGLITIKTKNVIFNTNLYSKEQLSQGE